MNQTEQLRHSFHVTNFGLLPITFKILQGTKQNKRLLLSLNNKGHYPNIQHLAKYKV